MPFRAATVRERAVIYINYPLADARGSESCLFIKNYEEIIYKGDKIIPSVLSRDGEVQQWQTIPGKNLVY